MTFHAMTEHYEEITVCGKPALFTSIRIKRDTVPDGLYAYDVRHDDEYGGVRFGVPDVQKCRRRFYSVRRPLPQGHPAGVLERAPHRHRDLQKSSVRQHCHDRDKCGLHLERHQRVSDGLGKEQIKLAFEQSEKKLPICTSAPVRDF